MEIIFKGGIFLLLENISFFVGKLKWKICEIFGYDFSRLGRQKAKVKACLKIFEFFHFLVGIPTSNYRVGDIYEAISFFIFNICFL
jgi:hypothetical protein